MSEQNRSRAAAGEPTHPASPASKTADDIFLSPRVVDRQAFAEFSSQLRTLIDQAAAQTETLRAAAAEAQRTRDGLREAVNANQMKLDLATRALATIDQKTDQARRMVESASDMAGRIDELGAKADQIINERVGILCQRLNEAEESAASQVETLHARLAETISRAGSQEQSLRSAVDDTAGPNVARLTELVSRAESATNAPNGLAAMIDRADAAGRIAIRATSDLGAVREQAEQARKILADTLNTAVPIIDDAGAIQGHLETTVSEALSFTRSAKDSIATLVADQRQAIDEDVQRLQPIALQARAELAAILDAADTARRAADQATASADQAATRLASLLQQVQPWQRVLLSDNDNAPVGAAINNVVVELKRELRGVAGALRSLAERTEFAVEPERQPLPITITASLRSPNVDSAA